MDIEKLQIIRALWGKSSKIFEEIPQSPLFNEVVFVWGKTNYTRLKELGYDCILVSDDDMSSVKDIEMYYLKPISWKLGCEKFGRILFLDWDVKLNRQLDDTFWRSFDNAEFYAPVYAYPSLIENQIENVSKDVGKWLETITSFIYDFSWKYEDLRVLPNAGLVYISDISIAEKIINLIEEHNLKGLSEEFALYTLADCSLNDYINTYEPLGMFGRPSYNRFTLGKLNTNVASKLNSFVSSIKEKREYLIHD